MNALTLEGFYEDGRIQLGEIPDGVKRSRVVITFLDAQQLTKLEQREALRKRLLSRLQSGIDFGTEPLPQREDLYAARVNRY